MRNRLPRSAAISKARGGLFCGIVAMVGLLTSCNASVDDVVTLGSRSALPDGGRLAAARAMADCLAAVGIPTNVSDKKDQPVFIVPAPSDDTMVYYPPVSTGDDISVDSGSVAASAPDWLVRQWDEMSAGYEFGHALLFIGSEDRSADFGRCLETTGYTPPIEGDDPVTELRQKRALGEAGAAWAQCARDNGFPGIKDPDPPQTDQWQTQPSVLIPVTVSPAALEALVLVCPAFDSAAYDAYIEAQRRGQDGVEPVDPAFEIDSSVAPDLTQDDIREMTDALFDILLERPDSFDSGKDALSPPATPQSSG